MKVVVIKACDDREFGYICDHQASAAQAHHTTDLQLSQDAIDMHWCQAECIAEYNLRKRHLKSVANRQSDIEGPHIELAHVEPFSRANQLPSRIDEGNERAGNVQLELQMVRRNITLT